MAIHKKEGRKPVKAHATEKEPEYMVQVSDPKVLRKDLLETLREIIIFMQGYEKFRKLQEEKVATFTALKSDVKELNVLINHRLRKYLPKGKLKAVKEGTPELLPEEQEEEEQPRVRATAGREGREAPKKTELDELEVQLRDIENQLRRVQ